MSDPNLGNQRSLGAREVRAAGETNPVPRLETGDELKADDLRDIRDKAESQNQIATGPPRQLKPQPRPSAGGPLLRVMLPADFAVVENVGVTPAGLSIQSVWMRAIREDTGETIRVELPPTLQGTNIEFLSGDMNVQRPFLNRRDVRGQIRTTVPGNAVGLVGEVRVTAYGETQRILPEYRENDILIVAPLSYPSVRREGLDGLGHFLQDPPSSSEFDVVYQDLNVDARQWSSEVRMPPYVDVAESSGS